jgi:hypothetical protein
MSTLDMKTPLRVADEVDAIILRHRLPEFAEYIPVFREHADHDDPEWVDRAERAVAAFRVAHAERMAQDGVEAAESAELDTAIAAAQTWLENLFRYVTLARTRKTKEAETAKLRLLRGKLYDITYRQNRADIPGVLRALRGVNLTTLRIPAAFIAKGQPLVDTIIRERADAIRAQGSSRIANLKVDRAVSELVDLLWELKAAIDVVAGVAEVEIPGFDLSLLMVASRTSPEDDGEESEEEPEPDETPGEEPGEDPGAAASGTTRLNPPPNGLV